LATGLTAPVTECRGYEPLSGPLKKKLPNPRHCALETGALETGALETGALETGALETGALKTGPQENQDSTDWADKRDATQNFGTKIDCRTVIFARQSHSSRGPLARL